MKCVSTSACEYMGQRFKNYDQIPRELTGCSQICTCNYGNVTCRDLCEPVPTIPPHDLHCAPEHAVIVTLPGETCCRAWQCATHSVESELLLCFSYDLVLIMLSILFIFKELMFSFSDNMGPFSLIYIILFYISLPITNEQ